MAISKKLSPVVDTLGLITPERMEELRAEAREKVKAKLRKEAEIKLRSQFEEEIERELDPRPEYEMRSIVIDCAEHTECIRIDGKYFFYGQRYDVEKPIYDQLIDMIARGWAHEKEISAPSGRVRSLNRGTVIHGLNNQPQPGVNF